jgi:opacity protein-like surface antigen
VFGNVQWRYRLANSITPYLGGGGGVIFSDLSVDTISGYDVSVNGEDSDVDTVGAYQAFAGVQFDLSDTTSLGLAYKFLGTSGPAWNFSGAKVELDDVQVHTLALTLTYRF